LLALKFYNHRDIRLEEIQKPVPNIDEVLIRVTDAGISQTQINEFVEGPFLINREPHPRTGIGVPIIPCQEYGGVIEDVGESVEKELIGKQVAVLPLTSCGECEHCKSGDQNYCSEMAYHGLLGSHGGFAEYSVVNRRNIFEVENKDILTFIEPILVAIHSANIYQQLKTLKGKRVLILGAGAIGISIASVYRDFFGADIVINDTLNTRLDRAERSGLKTLSKENLVEKFDLVVDAAGMDTMVENPALVEAQNYLKKGGAILNIGTYFHPLSMVPSSLLLNEHIILTSITYNFADVEMLGRVVKSLNLDFSSFIDYITLDRIIEDGYYKVEIDKESFIRIVVNP
jgi:(R,R)-butanediol dehydrogenase/meso-butanediol dehydrogenase/diacetyl reductase